MLKPPLTPALSPSDGERVAKGRVGGVPANPLIIIGKWYYTASEAFSGGIGFHADAGADEVAVAEHVVDAAYGGPELVVVQPFGGETGLFA